MGHWEWRVFFRTQQGGSEDGGAASTGSGDPGGASSASGSGDGVVSDCASDGITDHHQPDIFGKDGLHPHVEKRTDVYLSRYTSAVCGVKARGGEAYVDVLTESHIVTGSLHRPHQAHLASALTSSVA